MHSEQKESFWHLPLLAPPVEGLSLNSPRLQNALCCSHTADNHGMHSCIRCSSAGRKTLMTPMCRCCLQSGYVSLRDVCDVELRAGDVLLLEADQSFKKRFKANPAFGLVRVKLG